MRTTIFRICALIVWIVATSSVALAQSGTQASEAAEPTAPRGPFLFLPDDKISLKPDGSYLFQHTDGDLVFEAQIAPDVRIVDNFGRALDNVLDSKKRHFAYAAFGTFLTRLRMFDEESNPVRTPSYMPKGTIQLAWMKNLSTKDSESEPLEFLKGPIDMWLVNVIPFGHHSNGQNGCLFLEQVRIEGECQPQTPASTRPEDVNRENGSFSTNYIRMGLEYRRLHLVGNYPEELRAVSQREWGIGGSLELNPSGYIGGSISDTLKPLYGPTRFRITADAVAGNWRVPVWRRLNCGRAWADASVTFIHGAADSVDTVATSLEAACLPEGWGGAGLFVRYYRGQDYYNAAFLENINRLQFGLTFLQGKFLAFARK
jgi:hypothetical protein